MNSTQLNKTARFRFSTKHLKSKVVLQIVCFVPVFLDPKLIFYISTSELLFTNFKNAVFSSRPTIQCCFAILECFENMGVVYQITRSQTIISLSPYSKESKALIQIKQYNVGKMQLLRQSSQILQSLGLSMPRSHWQYSSLSVLSDKCEAMQSTYGSVDSPRESGEHWSAPKQGDRTKELKEITAMLIE